MTQKEIKEIIEEAQRYIKQTSKSQEESKKALIQSGIYSEKGNLRKPYNGRV